MINEVYFSERAYISILKETQARISTETGGIFLGRVVDEKWYIVEALDPGPKSVFMTAYFEYDRKYLEHLIGKINHLYKAPLRILGLWHRHPGSFNSFSSTDDGTNYEFSRLNKQGAISALVNIEPGFALTVYHVAPSRPIQYQRVNFAVGDNYIPKEFLAHASIDETMKDINEYRNRKCLMDIESEIKPKINIRKIIFEALKKAEQIRITFDDLRKEILRVFSDAETNRLLEVIESDMEFFKKGGLNFRVRMKGSMIQLSFDNKNSISLLFGFLSDGISFFMFENKPYYYAPSFFEKKTDAKKSK